MRLIDADALNRELQRRVGSPTDDKLYEVNLCIIDAPTIDAIPVEWLQGIRDILHRGSSRAAGDMLNRVIEMWQKEQGA